MLTLGVSAGPLGQLSTSTYCFLCNKQVDETCDGGGIGGGEGEGRPDS